MTSEKCRICLDVGVFHNIFEVRESMMISTKIMSMAKVSILPNDGLPPIICSKCTVRVNDCFEFVKLCEKSDWRLRTLLDNNQSNARIKKDVKKSYFSDEEERKKLSKSESLEELCIDENVDSISSCLNRNIVVKNEKENNDLEHNFDAIKIYEELKSQKEQCFTCGKVLSSRFRLKTHLRTHSGERPFSCPHCKKNFSLAQNLKVHLRIHTGEKPLKCPVCNEKFAHSAGLTVHRRKHSGQMPYQCKLCPRSFRTIGHLQYHTRRHTGERNFECDTCGRAFITRSDLKRHLLTHSGTRFHICCICGTRLTRASHLKRHIRFIHKEQKQSEFEHNVPMSKEKLVDINIDLHQG